MIRAISGTTGNIVQVTMLTSHRRALLLNRLQADGRLVAADLAREMSLSEDTLRRDLRQMAGEGLLLRVHGGALPLSPTHLPLARRQGLEAAAKARLARAAVGLLGPGQVIILDGGTTNIALAGLIPAELNATVVTHSPGVAAALEAKTGIDILLIGGRVFRHSMVAMGPGTAEAYGRLRADLCFVGVTGVQAEAGLSTGDPEEAVLKGIMMRAAAETVVLATPDKLGAASAWTIAPLGAMGRMISAGARPVWLPEGCGHSSA